jgi:hypothetical protein
MSARRSFSLKFLCFEFTKQVIWTKGSLEEPMSRKETWSFQIVPERLLPSILTFLAVIGISQLEHFMIHSLTTTGPCPIQNPFYLLLQVAILVPIFAHTLRRR